MEEKEDKLNESEQLVDERKAILIENYEEYFNLANKVFKDQKYNAASTLFFKAIVAAVDLFVLKKDGFVPSSHTNRFKLVQEKHKEIYELLDRDFLFYQDSYTKKLSKEEAEVLKKDARRIKEMC
ncbi:hypothetical protein HY498_04325 [Candidatus Woesearchaeota archaeon]|nr:hypothetical protein [Candidatus Woesearchaeota archaeon]